MLQYEIRITKDNKGNIQWRTDFGDFEVRDDAETTHEIFNVAQELAKALTKLKAIA